MGVYCATDDFCVSGTGFPSYNDSYSQAGTYNSRDYYVGSVNGYYIFYDTGSFWCLATTLGGSPCFLQGKYPYSGTCPDLTFAYVSSYICLTPTPTPTIDCVVFDFRAIFDSDVTPTPTVSVTRTHTPTRSVTPTSTNNCPLIFVDASVNRITNTPTPTPSITPSVRVLRYRNNQIQCNFSGDVTFTTVNTVVSCPISRVFQDCNNGQIYYTTSNLSNPSGGDLTQFMIFESTVDGSYRCISYLGTNSNIIGASNIVLNNGPIGYSNLGECSICAITPTPTPTLTPTIPLVFQPPTCIVYYLSSGGVYSYEPVSEIITTLTVPNSLNTTGLAISPNRTYLYEINENTLRRWQITSIDPFVVENSVDLNLINSSNLQLGSFIAPRSNNHILSVDVSSNPQVIIEINAPTSNTSAGYSEKFELPINRISSGAAVYVSFGVNTVLILITSEGNNWYLSQYDTSTEELQLDILISPTITNAAGIFIYNSTFYVTDVDGNLFTIDTQSPYTITAINSIGNNINGIAQALPCLNLIFENNQPTYYVYRLCNDTVGPQTFVYQTLQSITINPGYTFRNENENNCWSFVETTTNVPSNSTDDIVVYEGNYFTSVYSTVYTNCTDCINNLPCERPTNLNDYNFTYGYNVNNGPNIFWPQSEDEICSIIYELYTDFTENNVIVGVSGELGQSESLNVGSYVYDGVSGVGGSGCDCIDDGVYVAASDSPGTFFSEGIIIEISNCIIINSYPCSPINGTSPSNLDGSECFELYIQVSSSPSSVCTSMGVPI